jgi:hypothetical protein
LPSLRIGGHVVFHFGPLAFIEQVQGVSGEPSDSVLSVVCIFVHE